MSIYQPDSTITVPSTIRAVRAQKATWGATASTPVLSRLSFHVAWLRGVLHRALRLVEPSLGGSGVVGGQVGLLWHR